MAFILHKEAGCLHTGNEALQRKKLGPKDLGSKMMMEEHTARTWSHGSLIHLEALLEEERKIEKQDPGGMEEQ